MDKQTLKRYVYLQKSIEKIEDERMKLAAGLVGAVNINDMPKGSANIDDRMAEVVAKMEELQQTLADELNVAIALRSRIEECLKILNEDEQLLIRYRYFDNQNWNVVTAFLYGERKDFNNKFENYLRRVTRKHGRILHKIKDF